MNYQQSYQDRTSLRRMARHEEPEFSNASILYSMEKFVKAVNEMEETILVPSRLLDLAVGDSNDTVSQKGLSNINTTMPHTDLYRLYNIVNKMKLELLWSQKSTDENNDDDDIDIDDRRTTKSSSTSLTTTTTSTTSTTSTDHVRLGHARCPSTTSMQSVQSASSLISSSSSSSDTDSDVGIEIDSGMETEDTINDRYANQAAENFRRHLHGLHRSIKRMTNAAEYLTLRYQADVGGQA
ncbi:sestrin homolog isoform X2 [Aphidius gifuensis]|uniref:sestrin homolog isoform X2 n=1 Tax=Aphidius gifuensis TaxID=684658 RepID=UPI001CDD0FB6|nr:sestrin homolog isoform X2 [Aphidius gifuensis]